MHAFSITTAQIAQQLGFGRRPDIFVILENSAIICQNLVNFQYPYTFNLIICMFENG